VFRVWVFPALALAVAVPWGAIRLVRRAPARRAALEALFVGYLAVALYVVFLPLPVRPGDTRSRSGYVNLVPMHTVVEIARDFPGLVVQQLVGNVVLFVPLGFLLPLLDRRCRRFVTTAAVALSSSAGIEIVQLALLLTLGARRSVDVDDVILNVAGAGLGYLAWRAAQAPARSSVAS
jgi:glycopeptide antibiotics resistance protein